MSAIRSMCHRVLLLEGGRIIKAGTPDEVALDYVERMRLKLEGRSFAEIQAEMKAGSINTVYTWDFRCRKQLLELLGGKWEP
jgi:ABC-type multidrug transport system ATPase subunit